MKRNKFIIILMVAIILINSIIIPEKSYAVAETAIAVAGTKAAAEILVAFVAIMASQGIKYATWNDANKMYKAFNEDSIPEIGEFTPPWLTSFGDIEYYMQNGYWEGDGPPPESNIFANIIQGILAGGLAISDLLDIGNKTKDIIDVLGNSQGENIVSTDIPPDIINGLKYYNVSTPGVYNLYLDGYIVQVEIAYRPDGKTLGYKSPIGSETVWSLGIENDLYVSLLKIRKNGVDGIDRTFGQYKPHITRFGTKFFPLTDLEQGIEPDIEELFKYNIQANSPIITDIPLPTIPLPQIEKLPQEKIEIVIMPDGTKKVIYDGDIDEIVGIITDTYPIEDMYPKPGTPPYELVETDEKTEIKPVIPPTPWPNPDIEPNPDLPENEQDVIPWIQVVINWISETNNTIKDIIIPPEEYVPPELDFEPLKNIVILDKFPFSLPWDYMSIIEKISQAREAPVIEVDFPINVSAVNWYQDVKFTIDFNRFTPLANIMRTMLFITFLIGLIILTRTFIGGA